MYLSRPNYILRFDNFGLENHLRNRLDILDWLNNYQGLANWLTAIVALVALYFAIREFLLKIRPYITTDIGIGEEKDGNGNLLAYRFFLILVNNGDYLGKAKITKAVLKIGDEIFPTYFKTALIVGKGENKKLSDLGHINRIGINKIINKEYRNNKITIEVEIVSKKISAKKYKYMTKIKYEIFVSNDRPEVHLIKENIT